MPGFETFQFDVGRKIKRKAASTITPDQLQFSVMKKNRIIMTHGPLVTFEQDLKASSDFTMITQKGGTVVRDSTDGSIRFDNTAGTPNIAILDQGKSHPVPSGSMSFDVIRPATGVDFSFGQSNPTGNWYLRAGLMRTRNADGSVVNPDVDQLLVNFNFLANTISPNIKRASAAVPGTLTAKNIDLNPYSKFTTFLDGTRIYVLGQDAAGMERILANWDVPPAFGLRGIDMPDAPGFWSWTLWNTNDKGANTNLKIKNLKTSLGGTVLTRDFSFVTYEDGEPVRDFDGNLYYSVSCSGFLGVWRFNPYSYQSTLVGQIYLKDIATKRYLVGVAGKIVLIRNDRALTGAKRRWLVLFSVYESSYQNANGNDSSDLAYAFLDSSPLRGMTICDNFKWVSGNVGLDTKNDPDLIFEEVSGDWILLHNTVATTPVIRRAKNLDDVFTAPYYHLKDAGVDVSNGEGGKLRKVGGKWYAVTNKYGTNPVTPQWRFFNINTGALEYTLLMPTRNLGNALESAWPNFVPVPCGDYYKFIMVTMDGTPLNLVDGTATLGTSNGSLVVLESQLIPGKEYDDRVLIS